jgi:hypothetical protein
VTAVTITVLRFNVFLWEYLFLLVNEPNENSYFYFVNVLGGCYKSEQITFIIKSNNFPMPSLYQH